MVTRDKGRIYGNCEEELPKKPVGQLSVDCRPSVGRLLAVCWPSVGRQLTDRRPTGFLQNTQPRSQGLSSLPPLVVGRKTLVAAGHVTTQNLGGKNRVSGKSE